MSGPFVAPCTDYILLPDWLRGFDPLYQEANRATEGYHRDLPHWRYEGASYFVTFRLQDSLPASALHELREAATTWETRLTAERHAIGGQLSNATRKAYEDFQRDQLVKMESDLDRGHGACVLRDPEVRRILQEALLYFDPKRCRMAAWVIMPNHVHVLCQPLPGWHLEGLAGSWKKHSAGRINRLLGRCGPLWQHETYDRIIRDGDHFRRVVRYIARNPQKALLPRNEASLWLNPVILGPDPG